MENYDLIHGIILSLFLILGLFLSSIYLASVNINKHINISATEALQICRIVLIILGILICMPLDIFAVIGSTDNHPALSIARGLLGSLLLECQPTTLLVIAIVRLRVSLCVGNPEVLVSKSSAYITLFVCLMFPVLAFVVTLISLMVSIEDQINAYPTTSNLTSTVGMVTCYQSPLSFTSMWTYRIFSLVSFDILPIGITCSLNMIIYQRLSTGSTSSTSRDSNDRNRHNRNKSKNINKHTIIATLVAAIVVWFPYVIVTVYTLNANETEIQILLKIEVYTKMSVYVLHPFFDVCLHPQRRQNVELLFQRLFSGSRINTMPTYSARRRIDHGYPVQRTSEVDTKTSINKNGICFKKTNSKTDMTIESRKEVVYRSKSEPGQTCRSSFENPQDKSNARIPNISTIFCAGTHDRRSASPNGLSEYSTIHVDFDDIMEIQNDSDTDINDVYCRRRSSLKVASVETSDIRSSFSTTSQKSDFSSCSCKSRNISKACSISGLSQKGRCHRHSLWRKRSSKNLRIESIPASPCERPDRICRIESPSNIGLDLIEGSIVRSESEISNISEYF